MGKIVTLADRNNGEEIYPHTITQAVYHKGLSLVQVLDSLDERVTQNAQNITEVREANTWKRYVPNL